MGQLRQKIRNKFFRRMYVCMFWRKNISSDLFVGFKSHAPLKCWFQLSIQRASSISSSHSCLYFFAGFHIFYITSNIFHYDWSISLKVIFLPLTCNGASSVSAPTDHYDGTGAIPRLVPRCANQRTTKAQPTQPRRTTNRPLQRRSGAPRPRWHGCEAQATKSATSVFLHFASTGAALPHSTAPSWEQLIPTLRDLARGAHHQHRPTAF